MSVDDPKETSVLRTTTAAMQSIADVVSVVAVITEVASADQPHSRITHLEQ
jgi:hypothetical protein